MVCVFLSDLRSWVYEAARITRAGNRILWIIILSSRGSNRVSVFDDAVFVAWRFQWQREWSLSNRTTIGTILFHAQ